MILFILGILLIIYSIYLIYKAKSITYEKHKSEEEYQAEFTKAIKAYEETVNKLKDKIDEQNRESSSIDLKIKYTENILEQKQKEIDKHNARLTKITEEYSKAMEQEKQNLENSLFVLKENSNNAAGKYFDALEKIYQNKEANFHKRIEEINAALAKERAELDKIRSTRAAAQKALLKEKEIKEQLSFYCLSASKEELEDIQKLERVKLDLHKPRILSMLIWSTFWQKKMTTLCNNVLGTSTVTGIYKITNQKNGMCYVGQSLDTAKRWKDHAKCGLGIDTPAANKLYKAMMEDGIWNFSWELLEECPKEELNEKEKFYIETYQSYDYGYNSSRGIGLNNNV